MILDVPKPALNDLGLGVSDNGIGHLNPQPLKYGRGSVLVLPILCLFRPVAEAADIMRQKLAAIVNVDIIRDAVLQDALAQGDQRRLRARRVRNGDTR